VRYALLIIKSDSEPVADAGPEFDALVRWWASLRAAGKLITSTQLGPRGTASTVSWRAQVPIVSDGPFLESKETVGGFAVLEVESKKEAIEIASSWPSPARFRIEVRPVQDD